MIFHIIFLKIDIDSYVMLLTIPIALKIPPTMANIYIIMLKLILWNVQNYAIW